MANQTLQALDDPQRPVRRTVRRLRWFIGSLREQVRHSFAETGVEFVLDDVKATAVFIEWVRAFEEQKPHRPDARRAYVGFAAGLMLRALIKHNPVRAVARPADADAAHPAYFWPEGHLYVAYCLNVRAAVLKQDFHEDRRSVPVLSELRTWWSFKENIAEDPSLSIAFLDLFAGDKPAWSMPGIFRGPAPPQLAAYQWGDGPA